MDIKARLKELAAWRGIFHSEADFQHSLSWILHQRFPKAGVRLEYPTRLLSKNESDLRHLDIWIEKRRIAFELKYKIDAFSGSWGGEQYSLKPGKAHRGRYQFVEDVKRLEELKETGNIRKGYAILLSNNERLWSRSRNPRGVSAKFSLEDGKTLKGILEWGSKNHDPIRLKDSYELKWKLYSKPNDCVFKCLVVRV